MQGLSKKKKVGVKLAECGNPTDPLPAVGAATDGSRKLGLKTNKYTPESKNFRTDTDPLSVCSHLLSNG